MNIWLTIIGMGLVTFATRLIPVVTLRGRPGPRLERVLRYVPPSIFAALIVPALLVPQDRLSLGASLWAGLLGLAVAGLTRNMALTIIAGLAAFALLRALGFAG